MKRSTHEFCEIDASGYGYATYEDEDGWWWEFLEPRTDPLENPAIAGMGPFPTRSKALQEAARDWQMMGVYSDDEKAYALALLEHADYYRYEEDA